MITYDGALNELRGIASQEASIPALRASLFLFAAFAAIAWVRRRPRVALLALSTGGLLGLGYWLVQIASPLGFGIDPALTRTWAQAGVSALAKPGGSGFVWGTQPQVSLVSALASAGVPLDLVFLVPQISALMTLALLISVPFAFSRNRTTAAFAASLALGGGIWPGAAPYGSILLRPPAVIVLAVLLGILLLMGQARKARRVLSRSRLVAALALITWATLSRALAGGAESPATGALSLVATVFILASPLRAALRLGFASSASRRRAEAVLLLCVFGGSGLVWWDPPRSVAGFNQARDVNEALLEPIDWIRRNVPATSVVIASPEYSAAIAAFAGRRVLMPPSEPGSQTPLREPFRRSRLIESVRLGQPVERLADAFSVTHLLLGPGEPGPGVGAEPSPINEPRMNLVLVYEDVKDFRVFRLAKK